MNAQTVFVFEWPKFYDRFCELPNDQHGEPMRFTIAREEVPAGEVYSVRIWFDRPDDAVCYIRSYLNPKADSLRDLVELVWRAVNLAQLRGRTVVFSHYPIHPDIIDASAEYVV